MTSRQPVTTRIAPSAAIGISRNTNGSSATKPRIHMPWNMVDRRVVGARLHVGGRAHDDAGHRQRAGNAAQQIADALRAQFLVVVGAHAVVHAIDRSGRQQGFGAGDEGDRKRGGDDRRVAQSARAMPASGSAIAPTIDSGT